ncbi:vanillate transporter [Rhodococcus ruber BKS 20-38]|uniref:Vanillate transporter n=1 Tax=Rhodococcus ruber BKS 20-38 TaxID=1278076 RepID=M2Z081_9NOCA|nr:MFS transporter [Rhodococcus ruber]EME60642.1 vanillate transporter [Rhodococcus ruber BKS 20-38]
MELDLRHRIATGPMSRFQWTAVALCVLLNVLDGFDVLVMAFTSQSVSQEWGISGSVLGLLLSAGLFGMAIGSIALAPWADRVGRRTMILVCLALSSTGMLLAAVSQNAGQLGALRVLTGIGIGGILASSNVISSEFASNRFRGLAVTLNSTGYAVGATLGGVVAVVLQSTSGWRSVFLFGGVCTAALIPLVWFRLPESLDFLFARRPANALERINSFAVRAGHPPVRALPPASAAADTRKSGVGPAELLAPGQRRSTLLIWGAFFLTMFGFYFVTSWTPKLLVEAGMSATQGITGGVLLNLGGILGTALLGVMTVRFRLGRVLVGYLLVSAILLAAFVPATVTVAVGFVLGAAIGVVVNGCIGGLYALTPAVYAPSLRATGMGWGIGVGRIGAIMSPIVAGAFLDAGWTAAELYLLVAVAFLGAAVVVSAVRLTARSDVTTVEGERTTV